MPYAPHNRISLSGVFGTVATPVEEWSWSFATSPSTAGDPASYVALATEAKNAYTTHLRALFGSTVILTKVRAAAIGPDGKVPRTGVGEYVQGDWVGGEGGTGVQNYAHPLQQALVVTLMTPRAGSTGRGRFFVPAPVDIVQSSFRYSAGSTANWATKFGAFLSQVAASNAFVGGIEVASSKGYSSPVTSIRVGDVPDTMRSRRGRMLEAWATAAVTT